MMKLGYAIVVAVIASPTAVAQNAVPGDQGFANLDRDFDGYISAEEAVGQPDLVSNWNDFDSDGDGRLSKVEFTDYAPTADFSVDTPAEQERGQGFVSLDQDFDGYITSEEAAGQPGLIQQWSEIDADGDGQLDKAEFARFSSADVIDEESLTKPVGDWEQGFVNLDTNFDGFIDSEEAVGQPELTQQWNEIDTDSDGQLSKNEFSHFKLVE